MLELPPGITWTMVAVALVVAVLARRVLRIVFVVGVLIGVVVWLVPSVDLSFF